MAKGIVTKGGWRWSGRNWTEGDQIEAPDAQIQSWSRRGYVEPVKAAPTRAPRVESAVAEAAAETTAVRDNQPVHLGGGWYEVRGEKVQGKEEAERLARGR